MNKLLIRLIQLFIVIAFLISWEYCSKHNIINEFIFSSPSKIFNCLVNLSKNNNLFNNIFITLREIIYAFVLCEIVSFIISIIFYEVPILFKILEPFLTVINSTPKIALGPLIIIIFGANSNSIIIMALLITLIINILTMYNGFINVDKNLLKLLSSLKATKLQKLRYLIIPSAFNVIINSLKINVSMTLIGVIMGEFLVSKSGIGYLIMYGTQIFNLTLVMTGIIIIIIISYLLFLLVSMIENYYIKKCS